MGRRARAWLLAAALLSGGPAVAVAAGATAVHGAAAQALYTYLRSQARWPWPQGPGEVVAVIGFQAHLPADAEAFRPLAFAQAQGEAQLALVELSTPEASARPAAVMPDPPAPSAGDGLEVATPADGVYGVFYRALSRATLPALSWERLLARDPRLGQRLEVRPAGRARFGVWVRRVRAPRNPPGLADALVGFSTSPRGDQTLAALGADALVAVPDDGASP